MPQIDPRTGLPVGYAGSPGARLMPMSGPGAGIQPGRNPFGGGGGMPPRGMPPGAAGPPQPIQAGGMPAGMGGAGPQLDSFGKIQRLLQLLGGKGRGMVDSLYRGPQGRPPVPPTPRNPYGSGALGNADALEKLRRAQMLQQIQAAQQAAAGRAVGGPLMAPPSPGPMREGMPGGGPAQDSLRMLEAMRAAGLSGR